MQSNNNPVVNPTFIKGVMLCFRGKAVVQVYHHFGDVDCGVVKLYRIISIISSIPFILVMEG